MTWTRKIILTHRAMVHGACKGKILLSQCPAVRTPGIVIILFLKAMSLYREKMIGSLL